MSLFCGTSFFMRGIPTLMVSKHYTHIQKTDEALSSSVYYFFMYGGGRGIRTPVTLPPNGFQDRPVMTTSVSLRVAT